MANFARFKIETSPSSDGGFDATAAATLNLQLEGTPAGVVQRTTFQVYSAGEVNPPLASKSAPLLTLVGASSGQKVDAATPGAVVQTVMPSSSLGGHSWVVRCLVNGGIDTNGRINPDYVFERLVTIRSTNGLRKEVLAEATAYSQRGAADAQNEIIDSLAGVNAQPITPNAPTVTFQTTAGSVDLLAYTVPSSPTGPGRFVLTFVVVRLKTAITGSGSVVIRAGTTTGGNDLLVDSAAWVAATPAGTVHGLGIAELGTAFTAARGYIAVLDAGATVKIRATTAGTISAGDATVDVYGFFVN